MDCFRAVAFRIGAFRDSENTREASIPPRRIARRESGDSMPSVGRSVGLCKFDRKFDVSHFYTFRRRSVTVNERCKYLPSQRDTGDIPKAPASACPLSSLVSRDFHRSSVPGSKLDL